AVLAGERRDSRGRAGPMRPEQRDHLARVDVEVEVAHDLDLPVPGAEAVGLEAHAHSPGPRGAAGCKLVVEDAVPRYASMTRASWLIASGVPSAIGGPQSSATGRSQRCRVRGSA